MRERKTRLLIFSIVVLSGVIVALYSSRTFQPRIVENLGIGLVTAGFVAMLLELIIRDELLDVIKEQLRSPLREYERGQGIASKFIKSFRNAEKRVDIVAISFTMGLHGYRSYVLDKIMKESCHIRILIISPDSPILEHRAGDEPDRDSKKLRQKIRDTLEECKAIEEEYQARAASKGSPRGSFSLKTHYGIPYFGYSRFDDLCFFTPYLAFDYGINSPVISVNSKNCHLFHRL